MRPRSAGRLLVLALASAGCAGAPAARKTGFGPPEWVQAEGWAADVSSGTALPRERALADARREAVAQVVRLYLPPKELAARADAVAKGVLAAPERYIAREEADEGRREAGFFKLRLKAAVLFRKVAEDLRSADLLAPEASQTAKLGLAIEDAGARGAVEQALKDRGFRMAAVSTATFVSEDRPGDAERASDWGRTAGLDAVIAGRSGAVPLDKVGDLFSCRARVELTLTDAKERRYLAGSFQENSALAPEAEVAKAKAVAAAAESAAEAMAVLLPRYVGAPKTLNLKADLLGTPEDVRRFEEEMRAMPRVKEIVLKEYIRGSAWLLVYADRMSAEDLAAAVLRTPSFAFDLRSVSGDEVELVRREKQ